MSSLLLIPLLLAALAAFLLYRGARGAVTLSDPTCSHCGYDLRWVTPGVNKACPECGSDLNAPHAVRFGARKRKPRLIYAGLVLVVLTIAAVPALKMLAYRNSPLNKKDLATSTLIANLATSADQPWDWQELERRLRAGQLSNQDCAAAIKQLIKFMQKSPTGWNWGYDFVKTVDGRGAISKEQFERLAKTVFNAQPKVRMRAKVRQGRPVGFQLQWATIFELLNQNIIYAIRSAHLDNDQPVELLDGQTFWGFENSSSPMSLAGSSRSERMERLSGHAPLLIDGGILVQSPPGKHTLTLEIDYGLVPQDVAFETDTPGQAKHWPKARCQWTRTLSIPFEIVPSAVSVVQLVTQTEFDPSNSISASTVLRASRTPGKLALRLTLSSKDLPVPLLCGVRITMDGKTQPLGLTDGNTVMSSTSFPRVSADVKTCTVTLQPAPEEAERRYDLDRIWGREIVLKDIPVQRDDLEDAAAESQPASTASPR